MPQLARWLTFIEQFDYEVVHRPGTKHGNADGLSRKPSDESTNDENENKSELDGQGRARREAARRRKSECKINSGAR